MGSIRTRTDNGKLFFDFRYQGIRCREHTPLQATTRNYRQLGQLLQKIEAEIVLGSFEYRKYFPASRNAVRLSFHEETPRFDDFCRIWTEEMKAQWRPSHVRGIGLTLTKYLLPYFGKKTLNQISKRDILQFRSELTAGNGLSASRINHIMTPLRMILNEAANRYEFTSPYHNIKSLKVPRTDIEPFSLEEISSILDSVRPDFKNYYTVRFFAGMRTSEIDGLQWQFVDFTRRQILIRQALVGGELVYTKNNSSFRIIDMSEPVYDALKVQSHVTGTTGFVFCTKNGNCLNSNNVTNRVWYPLLQNLGLRKRRPYQTRHTTATLWLAAGENPEWIAHQMGHTTTQMLFNVYSRFVPNLTRKDGSAFEKLIENKFP